MSLDNEIKELEVSYSRTERQVKWWKWMEFLSTWILPLMFMVLVFGHQYGAIFLIPMVIICLPSQIICRGKQEEKQEEATRIWSKIGDIKRSEHYTEKEEE